MTSAMPSPPENEEGGEVWVSFLTPHSRNHQKSMERKKLERFVATIHPLNHHDHD